ncbi:MAG: winged helix-turn-helix transcriptional regulator [Bacillota bacterium]
MNKETKLMQCGSKSYKCTVALALGVIGGKWKPLILWHLKDGTMRFGELRRTINGVTHKILTQHLRELEADGLINRSAYSQVPLKVEYSLTEKGRTVIPILSMISKWGADHC